MRHACCAFVAVFAGLVGVAPVSAQILPGGAPPKVVAPPQEIAHQGPSPRELERRFHQAQELVASGDYVEGLRLLQSILDADEDAFFSPDRDRPQRESSLKAETRTLIGSLPAAGRAAYEKQYGPAARRLLAEALATGDSDVLAAVVRGFFHTQAGYEAAYRLASEHLDHEWPLSAALCYQRLLATTHADDQFEPLLSIKAAISWRGAGRDDKALAVLSQLKRKYRRPAILLGGREIRLFTGGESPLDWLAATFGPPHEGTTVGPDQWTQARGDERRNAISSAGGPHLNGGWRASTLDGAANSPLDEKVLARAVGDRRVASETPDGSAFAGLPAGQPLLVDGLVIVHGLGDLRAYDAATGRLAWAASDKDQFLLDVLHSGGGPQGQAAGMSLLGQVVAHRGWNDLTWGTLSSDGEYVFCVEEGGMNGAPLAATARIQDYREHNRLMAYDVRTGRAVWETGGPRIDSSGDLDGGFFLGPPLVLDRRLYCLVEVGSEVRLFVLDPRSGRIDWSQVLTDSPAPLGDPYRRQSGLSPAYDGGILVCPVGSDQIVALDLTARNLLWRYRFRSAAEGYDPRRLQFLAVRQQQGTVLEQNLWLDPGPIVADSQILITPRDANELYCLNLLDGALAWKRPRGEGLFVAGVRHGKVLVVGKSSVQAFRLADGSEAWSEPATLPAPSGRGYLGESQYYLPLSSAEVAAIDVRDGRVTLRVRSFENRVPGNLVGVRGTIVSQGVDFVEAYRQLDSLETEVAAALAANPDDPWALATRGEIRLGQGKFGEAFADLRQVLAVRPDDVRVRELLVGSVLEGLRVDFAATRDLLPDVEGLLSEPAQRAAYHWLAAQGLLKTGEKQAAFEALLQFADPDVADAELDRVDATLLVRRDRLVRSRVQALLAGASDAERQRMQAALEARARELADATVGARRRFVDYFGTALAPSLAWRLVAPEAGREPSLAEEFRLQNLAGSTDREVATSAAARLVEMLLAAERPRDAAQIYAGIVQKQAAVPASEESTWRELSAKWLKNDEFHSALAAPTDWPRGRIDVAVDATLATGGGGGRQYFVPFEKDRSPFFNAASLEISPQLQHITARDGLGRKMWRRPLTLPAALPFSNVQLNRACARDHLLLISVGMQLIAVDTLAASDRAGPRELWRTSLSDFPQGAAIPRLMRRFRRQLPNQHQEVLGGIGPLTRDHLVIVRGEKLLALEPLTGKHLWIREGVKDGLELFGDDEYLVAAGDGRDAVVCRTLDGEVVRTAQLPPAGSRLDTFGRHLVTWRPEAEELALFDPLTEKPVWRRQFDRDALVTIVDGAEVAVLEPAGRLTLLTVADGHERWMANITPPSPNTEQLVMLRWHEGYLLICNERVPGGNNPWMPPAAGNLPVHGDLYAFDRATGRKLWPAPTRVEHQGLDLSQPAELPIIAFWRPTDGRQGNNPTSFGMLCIDKRTGRIVYDARLEEAVYYVDFDASAEKRQINLKLLASGLRLTFTDEPWPNAR